MNTSSYWADQLLTKYKEEATGYISDYVWRYGKGISSETKGASTTTVKELSIRDFCDAYPDCGDGFILMSDVEHNKEVFALYRLTRISVSRFYKTQKTKTPVTTVKFYYRSSVKFNDDPKNLSPEITEDEISYENVTVESLVDILDDFDVRIQRDK